MKTFSPYHFTLQANNNCIIIQSAIKSLEEYSTSMLVFEPKMTLAKQVAKESEALCSVAVNGKRDRVFSSYMLSEQPCPKNQKVDQHDRFHKEKSKKTSGKRVSI